MVAGFGYRGPQYGGLQPGPRPQASVWGPPDMSQQLQSGIAGIADKFGSAFKATSEWGAKEQQANALMGMVQPGGAYAGGQGSNSLGGGAAPDPVSGYNKSGKTPSFVQMEGGSPNPKLSGLIESTAATYKLAPDYLSRLTQIESNGNPNAFNSGSKASGLGQFVPGTWKQYGNGASPFDPGANMDATARLTVDNANVLRKGLGREPTQGELYLAHQQGSGGALALLRDPNARAVDVVKPSHVASNLPAGMRGQANSMTAGEFAGLWTGKFGEPRPAFMGQGGQPTPQQAQQQVAQQTSTVPVQADPRTANMTQAEIVAQDQAAGRTPPAMPTGAPVGQPLPTDKPSAAAVVQNNVATTQQRTAEAKAAPAQTFMGLPAVDPALTPGGTAQPGSPVPQMAGGQSRVYNQDPANPAGYPGADAKVMPAGTQGGPTAYPGSRGAPVDVPAPTGASVQSEAPTAAVQPQQAPQATQVPPAAIAGSGGSPAAQGGPSRDQVAYQASTQAVRQGLDPQLAKYLAAGIRAGDPQASALASQILGSQYGATKPVTQEAGGVIYERMPDGRWMPVAGQQNSKAPDVKSINGVDSQWDPQSQRWVPLGGPAAPNKVSLPVGDPRRKALGIGDTDTRLYQYDMKTGDLSPIANEGPRDDKTFSQENTLRESFHKDVEVQKYRAMEGAVAKLEDNFTQGNAQADQVAIVNLYKTIDPNSTVTSGEVNTQIAAAGIGAQIQREISSFIGQGKPFTPELRAKIYNVAQGMMVQAQKPIDNLAKITERRAAAYGLDPAKVVGESWQPRQFSRATGKTFLDKALEAGDNPDPAPTQGVPRPVIEPSSSSSFFFTTPGGAGLRRN